MGIQKDVGKNYSYRSDAEHYEHNAVGDVATGRRFKAVQMIPMKVYEATDSGDANVTYYGFANFGTATSSALWRILKEDTSAGSLEAADSNDNFDNIWDNREVLSYG